jgi:phosphoribosyl-ATP pyrophosphohydrolase
MSQILRELEQTIVQRQKLNEPRFYSCRLLTEGTLVERKVNEEAYELIEAAFKGERNAIVYEASDLMYHFLVLLRKYGVSLNDIESELLRRRTKNENN